MRLGFAVKVLGGGGLPSHDTRRWQSGPHLRVSLERLRAHNVIDFVYEPGAIHFTVGPEAKRLLPLLDRLIGDR